MHLQERFLHHVLGFADTAEHLVVVARARLMSVASGSGRSFPPWLRYFAAVPHTPAQT
jgi:hypothetical protein